MTFGEWILEHARWVFSGIGVAGIGYLGTLFRSRRKGKMHRQAGGTHKTVGVNASSSGPGDANVATGDIILGDNYYPPDERVMLLKEARREIETIDTSMLADVFRPGSDVLAAFNRFLPGAALAVQVYGRVRSFLFRKELLGSTYTSPSTRNFRWRFC